MKWCVFVLLLLVASANAALARSKPRNWQPGEVTEVRRPGEGRHPGSGTIGPQVLSGEPIIVPESSSFGVGWTVGIALPDADYVVTLSPPPRRSSLARLGAGSKLECSVEGKTLFLKDEKGAVFRADIRKRSTP